MKRRKFIQGVAAVSAFAVAPSVLQAKDAPANTLAYEDALKAITGGKEAKQSDKVKLTVPEIAENGAVVPVKVHVDHPMQEGNHVKAIHVLAKLNANSRCASISLTQMNGKGYFATRIKLAKTQEVVAVVELPDGIFIKNSQSVKVTIGGCG